MKKLALAAVLILVLILSGCTGFDIYKTKAAKTGTISVKTIPVDLDVRIEREGQLVAQGKSPLVFDQAIVNKNYIITATNADGKTATATRSITKTGGSVAVTLNLNEM